jgi:hypothetical protein
MNRKHAVTLIVATIGWASLCSGARLSYTVVDTSQVRCYDRSREVAYPSAGARFYGQDAQYEGLAPAYRDNGDGTVTDLNTGLMWQQDPGEKKTFDEAVAGASRCRTGRYKDWRLPTIKELYSLINFNGADPDPRNYDPASLAPFIDRSVFRFQYGDDSKGDRIIDSQFATSTLYVSTTMGGNKTMFGVNFADGRIKGYPAGSMRGRKAKGYYVLYVRSNTDYGINQFKDNQDGTISDEATGLTWMKADSGRGMNWADALAYAENLELAGHSDWRLPNAKELQSIVDYRRSPDTTDSAAIDPLFRATRIVNELKAQDYPSYWTGTSHVRAGGHASAAVYVAFGRAMGYMRGRWMDVHGAGCQRSDPKAGDPADYPQGRGPQGDAIRISNYVRCVRGGTAEPRTSGPAVEAPSVQTQPARGERRGPPSGGEGEQGGGRPPRRGRPRPPAGGEGGFPDHGEGGRR